VLRRLIPVALIAATVAFAVPAYADGAVLFTLGRVVNSTPDKMNRIGIRSACDEPAGCKVNYTLRRGTSLLGGNQALFLGGTVQTDYVTLTKATAAAMRKRRMRVTITADASDPDGNRGTLTKVVTLGPKRR
jgi:hypothetical protein